MTHTPEHRIEALERQVGALTQQVEGFQPGVPLVTHAELDQRLQALSSGSATAQNLLHNGLFVFAFSAGARTDVGAAHGEVNVYLSGTTIIVDVFDRDAGAWSTIGHTTLTDGSDANSLHTHGITIVKSSTETIDTSTTLQDDDELTFEAEINSVYAIEAILLINTPSAADWKFLWTLPASATIDGAADNLAGGLPINFDEASAAAEIDAFNSFDTAVPMRATLITGGTAGTVVIQWAQRTSDGGNTSVLANSWLHYRKIA